MAKHNHAYDIAFEIETDNKKGDVSDSEYIAAILRRLASLVEGTDGDLALAIGLPFDTYESEGEEAA